MALKVGDKAPEFKLKDSFEKEVSLSDFKGKRIKGKLNFSINF